MLSEILNILAQSIITNINKGITGMSIPLLISVTFPEKSQIWYSLIEQGLKCGYPENMILQMQYPNLSYYHHWIIASSWPAVDTTWQSASVALYSLLHPSLHTTQHKTNINVDMHTTPQNKHNKYSTALTSLEIDTKQYMHVSVSLQIKAYFTIT